MCFHGIFSIRVPVICNTHNSTLFRIRTKGYEADAARPSIINQCINYKVTVTVVLFLIASVMIGLTHSDVESTVMSKNLRTETVFIPWTAKTTHTRTDMHLMKHEVTWRQFAVYYDIQQTDALCHSIYWWV